MEEKEQKKIDKKIEKEVEQQVQQKVEKEVEKEVKKRLGERLASSAKGGLLKFSSEFKKQTLTAISAALGFLIALSWREPISSAVNDLVSNFGMEKSLVYYQFVSAFIVTFIGVLILMLVSRWNAKKS